MLKIINASLVLWCVFSLFLTIYFCFKFLVYMPAADLSGDIYGFTKDVFAIHNVHWIVIPKIIFALDMQLLNGRGSIISGMSLFFVVAAAGLVALKIYTAALASKSERLLLALSAFYLMTGAWLLESLTSQINVQWSSLIFFVVLLAFYFERYVKAHGGLVPLMLLSLAVLMCSGQLLILAYVYLFILSKRRFFYL